MADPETTSDTPLACYTEQLPQVRREFALHADRVEVRARWAFGRRFRNVVRLDDLSGRTTTLLIRNKLVKKAIAVGSLGVAAAVVLALPTYAPGVRALAPAGWSVAVVSFGLAAITWRKTPFIRFLRTDGSPGLDVGRAGPQAAAFETFVDQVRRAVRRRH